jgi:hypothetical protein
MRASLAGYLYWLAGEDPDSLTPDRALDEVQIQRYLHSGKAGRRSHRSLAALGSPIRSFRAGFSTLFPPSAPVEDARELSPLTDADFAVALKGCDTFRNPRTRAHSRAYLLLGRGAGLGGADMRRVAGDDVRRGAGGALWVTVRSPGRERRVPVLARFADALELLAGAAGENSLLVDSPPPTKPGQPNELADRILQRLRSGHPGLFATAQRLRKAWLAEQLANEAPLRAVLEAASLTSFRAVESLFRFCPPLPDDVELAAGLGATTVRPTPRWRAPGR